MTNGSGHPMGRWLRIIALLLVATGVGLWVTRPQPVDATLFDGVIADAGRGATVFAAAGCASCHTAPQSEPSEQPVLAGGRSFASPFGTFFAPNISSDPDFGIGSWTDRQIASAIMRGVGRNGEHLFPAFPYTTYVRAEPQDMADLIAYLRSLPAAQTPNRPHDVGFPFNVRLSLGGWKMLFFNQRYVTPASDDPLVMRGRYLVEALGHCGECHTARNLLGGTDRSAWLRGAPNPAGQGTIPDITPNRLTWSASDIVAYLETGFTPEFDSAGGEMAEVIKNTSRLPAEDRQAIAAYLKALPVSEN